MLRTLLIGAILTAATSIAAAADPLFGTWQLNLAKSKFSPGPAPKSMTRTYAASAQHTITLTINTTSADGKTGTTSYTYKNDGKTYPVSGNADADMASVTRVDALTANFKQIRTGAAIATGVRTVSKDGKTLTVAQKGTHASGTPFDDVLVYDRQ
jgi:predicted lipoprotein with Yx(FWY)xxD motif